MSNKMVPCKCCTKPILEARAVLEISNGMCKTCNMPNLTTNKLQDQPEYETEVWSRGGKL